MDFSLRVAGLPDLEQLHDVVSTTGWGITRESIRAILTWDPEAYLVAEDPAGRALGVGFGLRWERTGWIGHLVVRPEAQGVGIGKALFGRALERLKAAGAWPVYLTATTMGAPLYAKFGFQPDGGWSRWRGVVTAEAAERLVRPEDGAPSDPASQQPDGQPDGAAVEARVMEAADLPSVVRFDAERFGDDRGQALRYLFAAYPGGGRCAVRPDGSLAGYLLHGTEGLGPFVAEKAAVRPLLAAATTLFPGEPLSLTFPDGNRLALEVCREAGLAPFRTWLRMRLGPDASPPRDVCIFNASVAKG